MQFPLVHVSWALADNTQRPACDAFLRDVFGAEAAYEILVTPETEALGLDREESLMMIGDTMVIPIAPAGRGAQAGNPLGDMLRRSAGAARWIGLALKVADLAAADAWFAGRGFRRFYDPGMEAHYFLVPRSEMLGMRLEIVKQDMPNDPRRDPAWRPAGGAGGYGPLGIEGLQAVGVSTPSLAQARALFADRLEWPDLGERELADACCAAFAMGDTVLEALEGAPGSPVACHAQDIGGICHLVFKVRDAAAAMACLRGQGLPLVGTQDTRFAVHPDAAHGRLIWLTGQTPPGYPAPGSRLGRGIVAQP
ncbi:glyoxalase [Novosphingobium guangzhouense]|uniref:Glyoxalase n=1 Tax=Novosphingobium guangzhouense TaxID=1850347 RepID=A0A2K2FYX0_9SPHN|nr:glyoxalase [Novosphingobium guangzhouense]PNU03962.1 glyoxalase [Novosphingobium guangzhouense]